MCRCKTEKEMTRAIVKALIIQNGSVSSVLGEIHDLCCHAEIFKEMGLDGNDKEGVALGKLFDGLEVAMEASEKLEE
jgi:hypothetical protein